MTVCICGAEMMGVTPDGRPRCVACGSYETQEIEEPTVYHCESCRREAREGEPMAFKNPRSGTYYCGCRGWN